VPALSETLEPAAVTAAEPATEAQPVEAATAAGATPTEAQPADTAAAALPPAAPDTLSPVEDSPPREQIQRHQRDDPPNKQPTRKKQKTEQRTEQQPQRRSSDGAGGRDETSVTASAAERGGKGRLDAGGSAAVSRYPGLVQARLKRALRTPRGVRAPGEVQVMFTVLADGRATGVHVARSSGSPALDQAALDTVTRAAPFPPIPADAGRKTWTFTMPLQFRR
jgi:protein TonB